MYDAFLAYLVGLWSAGLLIGFTVEVTITAGCGGVGEWGMQVFGLSLFALYWRALGRREGWGGEGFVVRLLACRSMIYAVPCSSGAGMFWVW